MKFKERYIPEARLNERKADDKRVALSDDAFAIGEMIEELVDKLERLRISSLNRN